LGFFETLVTICQSIRHNVSGELTLFGLLLKYTMQMRIWLLDMRSNQRECTERKISKYFLD
jgi:hypothetical protein